MSGVGSSWENGTRELLSLKDTVELKMSGLGHPGHCREERPYPSGLSWQPRADRFFWVFKERKSQEWKQDQQERQSRKIMWMDEKAAQGFMCWGRSIWVTSLISQVFLFVFCFEWCLQTSLLIQSLMRLYFGLNKCFLDLTSDNSPGTSLSFPHWFLIKGDCSKENVIFTCKMGF